MLMTLDNLIRISLQRAAEDTKMTDEQRVDLLLRVLTVYLTNRLNEDKFD